MLRRIGLAAAALAAAGFPLVRFTDALEPGIVRTATIGAAGVLALLFLSALADRGVHRAVDAANREMQGDRMFTLRPVSPLDATWGLFGSRAGGGLLACLRALLFAEFIVGLIVAGREPGPGQAALLLAGAGFGITVVLSLIQLKDHYPSRAPSPRER